MRAARRSLAAWHAVTAVLVAAGIVLFRTAPQGARTPRAASAARATAPPAPAAPVATAAGGSTSTDARASASPLPASEAAPAPPDPQAGAHALASADAAMAAGDVRAAVDALTDAVRRWPSPETHGRLGGLFLRMGVVAEAERHLEEAAERAPYDPDLWIALANAHALRPDPLAADAALERARAARPGVRIERDSAGWFVRGPDAPSS